MRQITPTNIAWLAGLYEGEGSLSRKISGGSPWQLVIQMTDKDVLDRIENIVGFGKVYMRKKQENQPTYRQAYVYNINRREYIQAFIAMIWPYLGERRKAKAKEYLDWYAIKP